MTVGRRDAAGRLAGRLAAVAVTAGLLSAARRADAADPVELELRIQDHRFQPTELRAPANTPVRITVRNMDDTAEEFDSTELRTEKVVAGGRSAIVRLPPMPPGRYAFVGEFHADTAKGVLVIE